MSDDMKSKIAIPKPPLRAEDISPRIHIIRRHRVMLDADLAELYGVTTARLNEQVKRNRHRFPDDFMFRLNPVEKAEVVAKCDNLPRLKFSPVLPKVWGAAVGSQVAGPSPRDPATSFNLRSRVQRGIPVSRAEASRWTSTQPIPRPISRFASTKARASS